VPYGELVARCLHLSDRTRIGRISDPDGHGTVIRKELLGPDAIARARNEAAVLGRLAGTEGVVALHAPYQEGAVLLVEDGGDVTLADLADGRAIAPPEILEIIRQLAASIGAVHRRGIVHQDLNPSNVMMRGGRPLLIDFELSLSVADARRPAAQDASIVGTLAYLAPEQSGRTGRPVDRRTDLYALGLTMYEVATGQRPFEDDDPLALIHHHLATVPRLAHEVNSRVPVALSLIIARLLEKEPDRRYQTADGLAYDLGRLATLSPADATAFVPGERDFPARLAPPAALIGRVDEVTALRRAFAAAIEGSRRPITVSGPAGIGKTALIAQLRSAACAAGGWFVTGKFDQYRQDSGQDAATHAVRGLARLLLAEPEESLAGLRPRMLSAMVTNAVLVAGIVPELATLLDLVPQIDDDESDKRVRARLVQGLLAFVRSVVSEQRPLVMFVDDLQWAGAASVALLDSLATTELPGLLLVGAYRESDLDAAHPLSAVMARWNALSIRLRNLAQPEVAELLAQMLRTPVGDVVDLATTIHARAGGNPFDTVEFVNALWRDGLLTPGDTSWNWDIRAVRRYVGDTDGLGLVAGRIARLPTDSRQVLNVMACLGNVVELDLLRAALALSAAEVGERLASATDDGLVVQGTDTVAFKHDRVQQAACLAMPVRARRLTHLTLARRLVASPRFAPVAAQQYLPAVGHLRDPAERLLVARLLRATAADLRLIDQVAAERLLAAASSLADAAPADLQNAIIQDRHRALYNLGRLAEVDACWRVIDQRIDPLQAAASAEVQISSLTIRGRLPEAVALGLDFLARLGSAPPEDDQLDAASERGLQDLRCWALTADPAKDTAREELADPTMRAAAKIVLQTLPPAFFSGHRTMVWLVATAQRLWADHGPCAALIGSLGHAGIVNVVWRFLSNSGRAEYRTGYEILRHLSVVSQARDWALETLHAGFLASISTMHWFEPLEQAIDTAQRIREGFLQHGDQFFACATFHTSVPSLLDCAASLDTYVSEVDAALELAKRTGNVSSAATTGTFRWLVSVLRAEPDYRLDEAAYVSGKGMSPMAIAYFHSTRALAALIFGDGSALAEHTDKAFGMLPSLGASYSTAILRLLRALTLIARLRTAEPPKRRALVNEISALRDWLAGRADDARGNYQHLVHLVDAEQAWAIGDAAAADLAFDTALREVSLHSRPWHHALIAERHGLWHLERGLEHTGGQLLREAYQAYLSWGATAKAQAMKDANPAIGGDGFDGTSTKPSTVISMSTRSGAFDLLAVAQAGQALGAETDLVKLRVRVTEILAALTGATTIGILLHDESQGWFLPAEPEPLPVERAVAHGRIPLSAFNVVQRTHEPLVVGDAIRDDRFARDPYFASIERCSLLVVPVQAQGVPRAMLFLENRLTRRAFTAERLDGVMLIAGQLAVSMNNALLYASLEGKVTERTEELRQANERLERLAMTDALTGLANRRLLDKQLEKEWTRGLRSGESLSVMMIDIDHFKLYNDHYGHQCGDETLRRVAAALHRSARNTDMVARYGGEEFAVVLVGATVQGAHVVAERARAAVAALGAEHTRSPIGHVTVSIGVTHTTPSRLSTVDDLVKAADDQLYEAKRNGRDQVAINAIAGAAHDEI